MERAYPVKDEVVYRTYFDEHPYCEACGGKDTISRHHIIKFGRSDEKTNLLVLCYRCHSLAEGLRVRNPETQELWPRLSIGVCLTIKKTRDPQDLNLPRLKELYGSSLPEMEQIPQWLVDEWNKSAVGKRLKK